MRKFTIAAVALSVSLGLGGGAAHADDDERDRRHRVNHDRGYHETHNRHQNRHIETVSVRLHRHFRDETLPLRRVLDLDRTYRGYRVREVTVHLRPNRSRGPISLVANGEVVDRARPREGRVLRLRLDDDRTLGRDLRSLQLDVHGRAFIDRIDVTMRAPGFRRVDDDGDHSEADRQRQALAGIIELILRGGMSGYAN